MSRYKFSTLLAGALLLLGGCASDEFTWRGKEVDSDKVMITLHRADFDRSNASTRSGDPSIEIKNLTLVTFKSDKTFSKVITIQDDQIDGSGKDQQNNDVFAVSIPYDQIADQTGHWYFFANAKDAITAWEAGSLADKHEDNLSKIIFTKESQWDAPSASNVNAVLFTPMINVGSVEPGTVLNSAKSTPLKRIYGKIDLAINLTGKDQKAYNLQVTGVALYQKSPATGDIVGTAETAPAEASSLTDLDWITPTGGDIYSGSATVTPPGSLKKGSALTMRTFPLAKEISSTNPKITQVLMIVRGHYQEGELDENGNVAQYTSDPIYYAVPVDGVAANQYWKATISGVGSAGSKTLEEAVNNPSGLSVTFEDKTAEITSMVSDGENALAVGDTIMINSAGNRVMVNGNPQQTFSVRFRYSNKETIPAAEILEYECVNENGNVITKPAWMNFGTPAITEETGHGSDGLKWYNAKFTVSLDENNGTDRECRYRFKMKDRATMVRDVLFLQQAPEGFNATSDAFSISLAISGASSTDNGTIPNYGKFVKTATTANGDDICYGIFPDNNGGRIRNEGLHIPMPNDEAVKYTYTVKVNNDKVKGNYTLTKSPNFPASLATIEGSPMSGTLSATTSWTVTCTTSGNYDYAVYRDALILKVGDSEYTLDLYHTGFFHKVNSKWGYYEVFTVPSTGSHWLDRNLGATSSGMAVHDNSSYLTGVWPISKGAEGAYLARTNVSGQMPKGWSVPSCGNFEAIFSQQEFTVIANNATGGTAYTAPSFSFNSKEVDRNNRVIDSAPKSIRAYFPCARYKQGNNFAGGNKSGYYITSTQSSGNYYQVAMFQGMNMISTTLNFDGTLYMPVRPVISSGNNASAKMYECNVLGYTHVALYAYNKATGLKTWITSWPGEQVVPYSADMLTSATGPLTVSKHFQKQVYYDYESNPDVELRVIFNICDQQGNVTRSNMVSETSVSSNKPYVGTPVASELTAHMQNRDGILFQHGDTYERYAPGSGTPAPGAKNGKWLGKGTKKAAQIVIKFPRFVKDEKIYDYLYLRDKQDAAISHTGTGKQSTAGFYKAKELSNGYYQVTLFIPYTDANAETINENYLKGVVGSHNFYNSSALANAYGDYVTWPTTSGVGVRYDSYNPTTKILNVTVWNGVGTTPPAPAAKPEAPKGTIYYLASNGNVPQNAGGDVYISYSGGTDPVSRQKMTKVTINGATWYKCENVPLDNTGLQVHSYDNSNDYQSSSDLRNIKADYESQNTKELYYSLDTNDGWKLKPYDINTPTDPERTYRIYWKWSNGWAQDRDYIYVYSEGDYNVLPENFTSGSVYPKSGQSDGKAYFEFKSTKTNLKFKFIVKKNNGTDNWELQSGNWTVESFTENNGIWENRNYQDTW
ncbi:MAG: hypothetical protein K2H96_09945 [Muribaculaceae bacterium]|nr:hypothetical protein [Muribaculaceae bacterium]